MVQTTITLDSNLSLFIDIFKAQRGFKNKNQAINEIIKEFKELKKEEFIDKSLAIESALMSQEALAKSWLSKEDEEAFNYLQ